MNGKHFFAIFLLAGCLSSGAQIIAPNNTGDIFRAEAMLVDDNFIGSLDQLALIDPSFLSPAEAERREWIKCLSMIHVNVDEAADLISKFIAKYGASENRFKAAMMLGDCFLNESPAKALDIYNNVDPATLTDGQQAELAYHKGYALLQLGNLDLAKIEFYKIDSSSLWGRRAAFYLGYIAYTDHDYLTAKNFLERANRSSLPGSMADYYLAQIYYAEGDYQKSFDMAQAAMRRNGISPQYIAEATRVAGESAFRLGDTKEAVRLLRQYVDSTKSPERSALYILGVYDFNSGKTKEAVDELRLTTDADDEMAQSAYLYIGQALMACGEQDAAILAFEKALKMEYNLEVQELAFYNYAVAKFAGARVPFGSSVATFEEFLTRYPNSRYAPDVQEYIVEGYLTDGNYDAALASINRMGNPSPKVMDAKQKVLYALGSKSLATGDTNRAVSYLRDALAVPANDKATAAQIALNLGDALARNGNHKQAVEQFNRYLAAAPSNDVNRNTAVYDLAYSYFALNDYANAAKFFGQLADIKKGDFQSPTLQADIHNRIADSKLFLGDYAAANTEYLNAYKIQPSAGDYPLFQMAVIQGYERKHKEKISTLNQMLEEFPTSSLVPDALLETTESYIQLGDNASAIATYRRLVAEYPSTEQGRRGYLQMGLTLLNSGKRAEAIEAYKDVVTLYPSSEEARMAVDELKRLSADDGSLAEFAQWLSSVEGAPQLDIAEADRLTFEAAEKAWITEQNISRLQSYINDYPSGSFRVRALGYLIDNASAKGAHGDVIAFAGEIVERYPDSSQAQNALFAKAAAEEALGFTADALASWEALEQRASSPQVLNAARAGIMRTARDKADYPRAIAAADALLASSALGSEMRTEVEFTRAFSMSQSGRQSEAAEVWGRLASNPNDLYGAKSAFYLAEYHFDAGNNDLARRQVESLIDSGTPHSYWLARGFILLSDIYAREGKDFEAREYLKSLRENYPGTEPDIFRMIDERLEK